MKKLFIIILTASILQTNNALSLCKMFCGKSNEGESAQTAYYNECLKKHPDTPRINRLHRQYLEAASKASKGSQDTEVESILQEQIDLISKRSDDCVKEMVKYFSEDVSSLT